MINAPPFRSLKHECLRTEFRTYGECGIISNLEFNLYASRGCAKFYNSREITGTREKYSPKKKTTFK